MPADFRLDFDQVTEMQQEFLRGANQLDDTLSALRDMANRLNDGALVGQGGDAFYSAIMDVLYVKVSNMREKFNEMANDLQAAMDFAAGKDTESAGRFNG